MSKYGKNTRERNVVRAGMANRAVSDDDVIPALRTYWKKLTVGVNDTDADINITDGSETDSAYDLPANAMVDDWALEVLTAEATGTTKTVDFGLLSTETGGDADGFGDGVDVSSTGVQAPTLVSTGQTRGVLISDDEDGAGVLVPGKHVGDGTAESVSLTAGSADFAELSANLYLKITEFEGA